jgi:hypothetical protein
MSDWRVVDTDRDNERECESRADAEETRDDLIALGAAPEDVEIVPPDDASTDGGATTPEVVDSDGPGLQQDPVDWMPEHFVDEIQGVPVVNRKGYCVIASRQGISVEAEPVVLPHETDHEYAAFRATATTSDGVEYSGFGSAHVDRQDGDDPHLLAELAETRAMKRATAWATGIGMTAMSEMTNGGAE